MLIAHQRKFTTSGEYAFIYTELIEGEAIGNASWAGGNGRIIDGYLNLKIKQIIYFLEDNQTKSTLKEAYQSLLIVSLNQPLGDGYGNFSQDVKDRALKKHKYKYDEDKVNYFTASFHDSVLLLCRAIKDQIEFINSSISSKKSSLRHHKKLYTEDSFRQGLIERMKNVSFMGVSGKVTIDADGDRIADYALLDQSDPDEGQFEVQEIFQNFLIKSSINNLIIFY
jgi:atrial natriuretic peptide receptor A